MYPKIFKKRSMVKRPVIIGVNNNRSRMRQRLIQHLQILVLILIFLILSMKLWIQIMPDWDPWNSDPQCESCARISPALVIKKYKSEGLSGDDDLSRQIEEIKYDRYYNNNDHKHKQYIDNDYDIDVTFDDDNYVKVSGEDDDRQQPSDFYIQPFQHNVFNDSDHEPSPSPYDYDYTIVTGASQNHFCPMKSFLYKMNTELQNYRINLIVYDLGFTEEQAVELYHLKKQGFLSSLRRFNFSYYPKFFNITQARGEYAWKPAIMAELAHEYPGSILTWLDSGTFVSKSYFRRLKSLLKYNKGFVSPRSSGFMRTWTHPGVYKFYNEANRRKYDSVPNCNGASMTFDTRKTKKLIDDWYKCALIKDCIAPKGSSRVNHRQDQAIITYLAAKEKIFCKNRKTDYAISTHQDRFCKKFNAEFEKNLSHFNKND